MNEQTIENGKTETKPLESEFDAADTAIVNLLRKLHEHEREREAGIVIACGAALHAARVRIFDPL
jgi:hypothetical protein